LFDRFTTAIAPAAPAYWDTVSAIGALIGVGAQYAYAEQAIILSEWRWTLSIHESG
jgi:hypothetical protein